MGVRLRAFVLCWEMKEHPKSGGWNITGTATLAYAPAEIIAARVSVSMEWRAYLALDLNGDRSDREYLVTVTAPDGKPSCEMGGILHFGNAASDAFEDNMPLPLRLHAVVGWHRVALSIGGALVADWLIEMRVLPKPKRAEGLPFKRLN